MTEAEQVHLWALLARANEEQREFVAQVKRLRETALTTADVVKRLSQLVVGLPEADRRRLGTEFVQAVVAGGFSGDLWRRPAPPRRVM